MLCVDNASAVKLAKTRFIIGRSMLKCGFYFVRECYQDGRIETQHIDGVKVSRFVDETVGLSAV